MPAARTDMDGLIVLLVLNLTSEPLPADSPELHRLEAVVEQRQTLCRHVEAMVGPALRPERGRIRTAGR